MLFLLAYWLYIDGVNTIIKMAVDYGLSLGSTPVACSRRCWSRSSSAFPRRSSSAGSASASAPQRGILIGIVRLCRHHGLGVFPDSEREFFAMAVDVGLVQGGVQSLSRSLFGRLVPAGKSGEFFGFYNMMGKFGTVVGPVLVGVVAGAHAQTRVISRSCCCSCRRRCLLLARAASGPPTS